MNHKNMSLKSVQFLNGIPKFWLTVLTGEKAAQNISMQLVQQGQRQFQPQPPLCPGCPPVQGGRFSVESEKNRVRASKKNQSR